MVKSAIPTLKKVVLCAEDDPDSCELLRLLLGRHEVVTVATLKKAVQVAKIGRFDLYVLNGTYPDGSGIDLCKEIRAFDPSTPIVFFSGLSEDSVIKEAMHAGAQAYLIKPDDIDQLADRVDQLLKG